jgi:anti-sigma factor RsiW
MTRYLLGQLSDAERAELEQDYLSDPRTLDQLVQFEADLLDDFVRGRLSPELHEQLARVYLANPERRARLKFSEALVEQLAREPSPATDAPSLAPSSWWQRFVASLKNRPTTFAFSAALVVLLALGSAWLLLRSARLRNELKQEQATQAAQEQHERELEQELAQEEARKQDLTAQLERERAQPTPQNQTSPAEKPAPAFVSLLLVAGDVRGAQPETPTLSIPKGTAEAHIQLQLGENEYESYQLELHEVGGKTIFNRQQVKPAITKSSANFAFSVPATKFVTGNYILSLKGVLRSGEVEDVSKSLFRVTKTP